MIELMSPCGGWEAMQAAIDNGADSVYFGVDQLNMRARATMNFTLADLEEISSRCSAAGVRTYLTLNTIIYDHDLSVIKTIIDEVKRTGITAIIVSDQACIAYAKQQEVEIHISTQLNVTNIETVKFYAMFSDTMVLSRELSLNQVKKITDQIKKEDIRGPGGELIEIEIFGHGALCVAVSGKCYMSLHTDNSSANRGACIQNCRKKYTVIDQETGTELEIDNEYIMSPKDLCTIDFLDQVAAAGVNVLKIEGRGKAPEYVATVTKCYRKAIDAIHDGTYTPEMGKELMKELETVYNRGFWGGYYLGQELGEFSAKPGSLATQKKVYIGKGIHYYPKAKIAEFKIEAQNLKQGDKILITGPTTGVYETIVESIMVDDTSVAETKRGDQCTIPLDQRIRLSDKLYKIVEA